MKYKIYKYRNLIDLVNRIPFKDIKRALKYHYPHPKIDEKTMNRYKEIVEEISRYKENSEKDKDWIITITLTRPYKFLSKSKEWVELTKPGEEYYNVSGKKKGEKITYAIEFTPWQKIANWQIHEDVLKHYKPEEIIAHILWEITYAGFEQKEIKKFTNELHNRIDKIKKNPKKYTKSYESKS